MTVTIVGVVYSKSQSLRRKVIKSDTSDTDIRLHKNYCLAGEGWLEIPIDIYNSFRLPQEVDEWVTQALGSSPLSDICAVIDADNNIVAVLCGDPVTDSHPHGVLIQEDEAAVGSTYDFESAQVVKP